MYWCSLPSVQSYLFDEQEGKPCDINTLKGIYLMILCRNFLIAVLSKKVTQRMKITR